MMILTEKKSARSTLEFGTISLTSYFDIANSEIVVSGYINKMV